MGEPTLGEKLGMTTQASALLQKAERFGLCADDLENLAVQRGCDYYSSTKYVPGAQIQISEFSNEELAIALLSPALRYSPQTIRFGAAMLGAEGNKPDCIVRLAKLEGCEAIVRYIAEAGHKYEPENLYWSKLLAMIPHLSLSRSGVVPHPTRFVTMTGITRRGVDTVIQWIRPRVMTSHG
jgi:hypothetical protein